MGLNRTSGSQYIIGLNRKSKYYGTQLDIRVKGYCHLNLMGAFVFDFERLDILWDSIAHPSQKLISFEFA